MSEYRLDKVKMFAPVSLDKHKRLKAIAQDRGVTLYRLAKEILEWAGDKDVTELIRLGVRLPIYPGEVGLQSTEDDK